ncbi:carboxypeptidase-like regulatory domain-containing protein [Paractinoplanes atraurantiacus]|uniref:Carboxypeptidase regulatory-like domain-containing protein n=1 Tax=Paractinoplanes atraurantiacus TaxID=1036182 RepID=A0A285GN10_9ACTN|nr:carboxypeptidase-like regulatory domain-containing protein [Actinoplanes atraurantiacus]SNY23886.1 Carboxypeptidase regulatory-like domain-containing protein [Actinoplanes atraurantiacus]
MNEASRSRAALPAAALLATVLLLGACDTPSQADEGVRGRVLDGAGAPITGATVTRRAIGPSSSPDLKVVTTDRDGRYDWPLDPGVWELEFTARDHSPATVGVTVADGQWQTIDIKLR